MQTVEQFWAKVDFNGPEHPLIGTRCWLWIPTRKSGRHGHLNWRGRAIGAHVLALILADGPLGRNKLAMHKCDNPPCVNPAHLQAGTVRDNVRDALSKGRLAFMFGASNPAKRPEVREKIRANHPMKRPEIRFKLTGENNPHSKLTPALVRMIRASSEPGVLLAKRFRLGASTISRVRLRRSWTHVDT